MSEISKTNEETGPSACPPAAGNTPAALPDTSPPDPQGPTATKATPKKAKPRRFRGWRGCLLRLALCVLSPIVFLGLLEGGLRLVGYGYPTGFFLGPDAKGVCTTNYKFGWRFFPRALARDPRPYVLEPKQPGTIRIVVLGESAAMGTPDPAFGFGPILGVMLGERYPGVKFEIVNGAITAINSHAIRDIARDCAARQPDLFVVYMGNNEVIGPYGPGTVFQQWMPNLSLIRTSLWVKSTRVGEMLGDVVRIFRGGQVVQHWQGLAMFKKNLVPADDPRLAATYDYFRQNLNDICATARRAGAAVVLSTVAVNLEDFPPLASLHRGDLAAEELAKWETFYKAAGELRAKDRWAEALEQYRAAAKIDDRYAELSFHLGECLSHSGSGAAAREQFERARDLDALRFRADSRINGIIREVAGEPALEGVRLVEGQQAVECGGLPALSKTTEATAGSAPTSASNVMKSEGKPSHSKESLFYEHVHLKFDGNYLLARAIFEQVTQALPQLADQAKAGELPSRQRCAELLAFTPFEECEAADIMASVTAGEPFVDQFDHEVRQAAARKECADLHALATAPGAKEAAWHTYEAAIAKAPDDWSLHHHFGRLAAQYREFDVAIDQFRMAMERVPWNNSIRNNLGVALVNRGQIDEAIGEYRAVLAINPFDVDAYFNMGIALAASGKLDEAIAAYGKALEIQPDNANAQFQLGVALAISGKADESIEHLRKALKINPNMADAHISLARLLIGRGQVEEAAEHYRKAVEIDPSNMEACNNLGFMLFHKGDKAGALAAFENAVQIKPDSAGAHFNLGMVLEAQGRFDGARVHFEKALALNPNWDVAFKKMAAFRAEHPEVKPKDSAAAADAAHTEPARMESGKKP